MAKKCLKSETQSLDQALTQLSAVSIYNYLFTLDSTLRRGNRD